MNDTLEMSERARRRSALRTLLERQKLDALHQHDEPTAQQCIIEAHQLESGTEG